MIHVSKPISGRQAARLAGASQKARVSLDELADLGVIERREVTGQYLYRFNRKNYFARALTTLFRVEEERTKALLRELHDALATEAGVLTGALFGSSARGTGGPRSDLDVVVVVKDQDTVADVTSALLDLAPGLRIRYGVRLSPIVLSEERWRAQLRDRSSFASSAAADARTFIGQPISGEEFQRSADRE